MAALSLVFDLLARDRASGAFNDVGNAAERAGNKGSAAGNLIGGAMKAAGGALLAGGLIAGLGSLYEAAAESAKIGALTTQVIKSTGSAANLTADQVGDLTGAISAKTGVDDEAIQSGANLLLTFTNIKNAAGDGNDIFTQTTEIMTDMSVALGTDASGSAVQLGKALNDPIKGVTALSKVGVAFTEEQKEQIRTMVESGDVMGAQKVILAELGKEFGGAAEAAATPVDKLKVNVGNLAETLGAYLIPAVNTAAEFVLDELIPALSDGATWAGEKFGGAFTVAAELIGDLVSVGGGFVDFIGKIPGPIQAGALALGAFLILRGPLVSMFETVALRALFMRDSLVAATTSTAGLRGAAGGLMGALGGPWGLAIAGATIGLGYLISSLSGSGDAADRARPDYDNLAESIKSVGGAIDETVRRAAAEELQNSGLLEFAEEWGVASSDMVDAALNQGDALSRVREQVEGYIAGLERQRAAIEGDTVGAQTNRAAIDGVIEAQRTRLGELDRLASTTGGAIASERELAGAITGTEGATTSASAATAAFDATVELAKEQVDQTRKTVDGLKLSLDILTGANVSAIEMEAAFRDSLAAADGVLEGLNGSVLDGTGKLDLHSESGRKAADVLLDVRNSGNEWIATLREQGATEDEVRARDAELRRSFIDTAHQMGITGGNADRLADQILGIPKERAVAITADTSQARAAVQGFIDWSVIKKIPLFGTSLGALAPKATGGILEFYANGGLTSMPGGIARMVPPNTWRVIGDRVVDDEAYIPINDDPRSRAILAETANRMGYELTVPMQWGAIVKQIPVAADAASLPALEAAARKIAETSSGVAGGGAVGGSWTSIWNWVRARIPQARQNSTFRPGDPGYHGRGKAIDFGFGSGPGGAGSAGLALINRTLHDGLGRNLAELIYDGIGDDRPDLKNGRPLTYNATTRAQHRNHVHAATYDDGGWLRPGYTLAYNGTGQPERITAPGDDLSGVEITGTLEIGGDGLARIINGHVTRTISGVNRNMNGRGVR